MRKIKEILRLKYECRFNDSAIAASCKIARSTVSEYIRRAQTAGLGWPIADDLDDWALELRLFPPSGESPGDKHLPDFVYIHDQLRDYKKLNLTKDMLWREYKEQYPDGYQYSQFCWHYQKWLHKTDYCMRQEHKWGEKLFVDYCDGLHITDPRTGERIPTQMFAAVWGASNYSYAEATLTQKLPDWIGSHVRAFDYFGCIPRILVPDCLKSGVTRPCRYEPDINPTYADMARHYGTAVIPARPKHPRDKAKVEAGVLIAKRWILAALRHRIFHSLEELNSAIKTLLEKLNTRLLRKLKKSRRELFESFDRDNACPMPMRPYEYAEWKKATVNIDYHVEIGSHYYSVPFRLIREKLDARITASVVEIFHKGERVAAHARSYAKHKHTTSKEHMPVDHQKYLEWTPSRIADWARKIGPHTEGLVIRIIESRIYPEQGYRSCLGILRLSRYYGVGRIESAAKRAMQYNACSFKSIRKILQFGLDRMDGTDVSKERTAVPTHENIRGCRYYDEQGGGHA